MARPQLEDGHTQIANEILDAFCRAFPGGANAQILWAIIRRTYGWHKKEDKVSISQLQEMTALSRRAVIYALQNLEAQNFITVQRQRGRGNVNQINTVAFQKNYDIWVVQRKSTQYEKQLQKQREKYQAEVVQRKAGSAKNDQKVVQRIEKGSAKKSEKVPILCTHKRKKDNTKDIQKKGLKQKFGEFLNVFLTVEEHEKLVNRFGEKDTSEKIEALSAYLKSRNKRYADHYATILNWARRDGKEANIGAHRGNSKAGRDFPSHGGYKSPEEHRRAGGY